MRVAQFKVGLELLANVLHLPDGAQIIAARAEAHEKAVTFWAEAPDLPEAPSLALATLCCPSYIGHYGASGEQTAVEFEDWNLRELC